MHPMTTVGRLSVELPGRESEVPPLVAMSGPGRVKDDMV